MVEDRATRHSLSKKKRKAARKSRSGRVSDRHGRTVTARQPKEKLKNLLWHNLLSFLTMGLDLSTQALFHQTTGPEASREVILGRIEDIKLALRGVAN